MNNTSIKDFFTAVKQGNKSVVISFVQRYPKEWKTARDEWDSSTLHWARDAEMAEYLILAGADIEALDKLGRTPFLNAALYGAEGPMNVLIEKGCNIHAKDEYGDGALGLASENGHLKIGKRLVELRLDVNESDQEGVTSLHRACKDNRVEMAEYLISAGADIEAVSKFGRTPFLEAAFYGAEGTLNVLIEKGCNIHAKAEAVYGNGALGLASEKGHLKIVKRLVGLGLDVNEANHNGSTSLHRACKKNHVEMAEYLISAGADIEALNKFGRTPFLNSALYGAEEPMNVLIEKGCNIHAKDETGGGALGCAIQKGHLKIVKRLIGLGLNVNEANQNGSTSLHRACQCDHVEMAEYLISAGADIEARNQWGRTPLLQAVFYGNVSVVDLLVNKGCNIDAKNNAGDGALQIADRRKHFKIKEDLVKIFSQPRDDPEAESELREKILRLEAGEGTLQIADRQKHFKMKEDLVKIFSQPRDDPEAESELREKILRLEAEKDKLLGDLEKTQRDLQQLRERAEADLRQERRRFADLQAQNARVSSQLTEENAQIRTQMARECSQLKQERDEAKQEYDEARLVAEEAQKNLSKYEEILKVPSTEIEQSGIKLGGGAYGEVRVGHWRGCQVAVKTFFDFLRVDTYRERLEQEISICSHVHHPNVVSLLGVISQDGIPLSILSELLEGSLSDVIKAAEGTLTLREQVDVSVGCSAGVRYLHGLNILHGDIRSTNVVVTSLMEAKICDLGAARFSDHSSLSAGPMSPNYLAPERSTQHNTKMADVYSLGVTFIELMTGREPAPTKRMAQATSVRHPPIKRLGLGMVKQGPRERPLIGECLSQLIAVQKSDQEYRRCPAKRMVKGKVYGGGKVHLVKEPWL
ncbi:ankyrin repeat domain-containing protein 17-like isoform X3 [Oscarella lobularis]|uniref:ankyrin repeat domain-containing protein 17-like isoform X3 n=2 Tax=Oscarella lobularis TaxID=121494 RepID=UPI0033132CF3